MRIAILISFLLNLFAAQSAQAALSFDEALAIYAEFEKAYAPIMTTRNQRIDLSLDWESDGKVGTAGIKKRDLSVLWIFFQGGALRTSTMTADVFRLQICHEMGHLLGEQPLIRKGLSVEGQADYYATAKCLRKIFEAQDNEAVVSKMTIPTTIAQSCQSVFKNQKDILICIRSAMAGLAAVVNYRELAPKYAKLPMPAFEMPATEIKSIRGFKYPSLQCRLDTYLAGALCAKSHSDDFSLLDINTGACTEGIGSRPKCWFAVNKFDPQ